MGEKRVFGLHSGDDPGFWYGVSLYLQQKIIIEQSKAKKELGEAGKLKVKYPPPFRPRPATEKDRKITIDENGVLSGTPGEADSGTGIPVSITVRDAEGLADTLVTVINVLNVNDPPVFLTADILDAVEGAAYSDTLRAEDPDEGDVLTFTLLESPEWLSVDESGILSGTPEDGDVGEDIPVTVTVTDAAGLADTLAVTINVVNVNEPPAFVTEALPDAVEGTAYTDTLLAEDPDKDDVLAFALIEAPEWLALDEAGVLSGTPGNDDVGVDLSLIHI